jgi:hypothetical protein
MKERKINTNSLVKLPSLGMGGLNGSLSYGGWENSNIHKLLPVSVFNPLKDGPNGYEYSCGLFRYMNNHMYKKLKSLIKKYNSIVDKIAEKMAIDKIKKEVGKIDISGMGYYENYIKSNPNHRDKNKLLNPIIKMLDSAYEIKPLEDELNILAKKIISHLKEMDKFFSKENWVENLNANNHINELLAYRVNQYNQVGEILFKVGDLILNGIDFDKGTYPDLEVKNNDSKGHDFISVKNTSKMMVVKPETRQRLNEYVMFGKCYGNFEADDANWSLLSNVFAMEEKYCHEILGGNHTEAKVYLKSDYDKTLKEASDHYLNKPVNIKDGEHNDQSLKIDKIEVGYDLKPRFQISGDKIWYGKEFTLEEIELK